MKNDLHLYSYLYLNKLDNIKAGAQKWLDFEAFLGALPPIYI